MHNMCTLLSVGTRAQTCVHGSMCALLLSQVNYVTLMRNYGYSYLLPARVECLVEETDDFMMFFSCLKFLGTNNLKQVELTSWHELQRKQPILRF